MAAFAALSLLDGVVIPVAHTFNPTVQRVEKDGRLYFEWSDFSVNGGVPIGGNRVQMWVTPMSLSTKLAGDSRLMIEVKVDVPVLETLSNNTSSGINPQPTLAYGTPFWFKTIRNGRAVSQPSKDGLSYLRDFLSKTVFTDILFSLQNPT